MSAPGVSATGVSAPGVSAPGVSAPSYLNNFDTTLPLNPGPHIDSPKIKRQTQRQTQKPTV
jgi:hypothetical protein